MSAYSEYLRPFHRPGLEAAGEDEWDDTPAASGEVGMAPVVRTGPSPLCMHGWKDCYMCDRECRRHGFKCSCWAHGLIKPETEAGF